MWRFKCRFPLGMRFKLPPPVTRKRFFTALFVLKVGGPALRLPHRTCRKRQRGSELALLLGVKGAAKKGARHAAEKVLKGE